MVRVVSRVFGRLCGGEIGNGGRQSSKVRSWRRPRRDGCTGWPIAAEVAVSNEGVCVLGFLIGFLFFYLFLGTLFVNSELPPGTPLCCTA